MALRSAGGPAVAPVSPMPPGASPLLMTWTSIFGALVDAQHAIVVEVGLLDAPLVDGDLAIERRRQAEDQPALAAAPRWYRD